MREITESEIKAMTKEENYLRGYKDGKADMLEKIMRVQRETLKMFRRFEGDNQ